MKIEKRDEKFILILDDNREIEITRRKKEGDGTYSRILPEIDELKEYPKYIREYKIVDIYELEKKNSNNSNNSNNSTKSKSTKSKEIIKDIRDFLDEENLKRYDEIIEIARQRMIDDNIAKNNKRIEELEREIARLKEENERIEKTR